MGDGWRVSEDLPSPRQRRVALLLWLLPLWLIVSSGAGMWWYFHRQAAADQVEQVRFSTGVSEQGLRDDVEKFLTFVGERHPGSEAGVQGLNRAAAMIEGSLGPENAGYRIERVNGPVTPAGRWPLLIATLRGKEEKAEPLWVIAGYDSRPGSPGAEANASGTASAIAAAHALANAAPRRSVHFAFLPHACAPDSPLAETQQILAKRICSASSVLVVEATGSAAALMISSRDAANPALQQAGGLGEVVGAEVICLEDDFDLSATLFELGLPAVRVSTRPVVKVDEADGSAPNPALHAAATRSLVSLIERLAGS